MAATLKIGVTMGDPAGIGPEIVLRALCDEALRERADFVVYGDGALFDRLARDQGLEAPSDVREVSHLVEDDVGPGRPTVASARAMIDAIEAGANAALSGEIDAVVTAPINKAAAGLAGFTFPGHTEFLAHLAGTRDYVMMLGGKDLKVSLVTIHEALRDVPGLITIEKILKTIKITADSLKKYFAIEKPRIGVAGLNPHAGEGGRFGTEEIEIIGPAIEEARREGSGAEGPVAPDTIFYRAARKGEFDAVVAMYHDQGLGPLKLLHFEDGVNMTLGLPIIRTSPDHGTAYEIAWKGVASPASMKEAVRTAIFMAENAAKVKDPL